MNSKIILIFCLFTVLSQSVSAQMDTVLFNGCPYGGEKIIELTGNLTQNDDQRHKPIQLGYCMRSNRTYPFKIYWIKIIGNSPILISTIGDVDVSLYNAYSFQKDVTCNGILYLTANESADIPAYYAGKIIAVVVHAAKLNDFPAFKIQFSKDVSLYSDACIVHYDCFKDTYSTEKSPPIFSPDLENDIVISKKEVSSTDFQTLGILEKTYSIGDQVIAKTEHPIFNESLDNVPELLDINVSCTYMDKLDPQALYEYLMSDFSDSLAFLSSYPYVIESNGKCKGSYLSYSDSIAPFPRSNFPYNVYRTYKFYQGNFESLVQRKQKITVTADQPVQIQRFEKMHDTENGWICVATFELPTPELYSECTPNRKFLKLYDETGKEYPYSQGSFGYAYLSRGEYKFYYIYDDLFNPPDTSILNVEIFRFNPPTSYILLHIQEEPYQVTNKIFSTRYDTNCTTYDEIEILEEPMTPCDSINDGNISICCALAQFPGETYYGRIKYKKFGLDSMDQISVVDSAEELIQFEFKQGFKGLECPADTTLDCNTIDIAPSYTGFANAIGTCTDIKVDNFIDHTIDISSLKSIVTRTFTYPKLGTEKFTCAQKIVLECTSGSKDLLANDHIKIYPNPALDVLNVEGTLDDEDVVVKITKLTGQKVLDSKFDNTTKSINVSTIPRGMYLFEISTHNKTLQKGKFVKH